MRLQWQQTVKNPNFVRMQQIAVGANRTSSAHPDVWYHRRWLLVSRFPGNTTILPEEGHQCWNAPSKDFEYLVCNAQTVNMHVKTQQEDHLLNFLVDNTLYSFVNLAAIKPQNAAPILSLVPLHMHGYLHVRLQG